MNARSTSTLYLALAAAAATHCILPATAREADIFVVNNGSGKIGEYTTAGATVNASLVTGLSYPEGLAISGGNLYVSTLYGGLGVNDTGTVTEYTASGTPVGGFGISGLNDPIGIAVSGGDLFVTNLTSNSPLTGEVEEYNATTGALINASFVTGLSDPLGIAVSGGDLFVTDEGRGTIGEYNASTGVAINPSLVTGLSSVDAIAVSGGDLFVTKSGPGTIGEYNASTGAVINASFVAASGGWSVPNGMAVFGNDIFFANGNPSFLGPAIGEYDANTGATVNASLVTALNSPVGIVVVPEPATCVMLASGAVALLACGRKRQS